MRNDTGVAAISASQLEHVNGFESILRADAKWTKMDYRSVGLLYSATFFVRYLETRNKMGWVEISLVLIVPMRCSWESWLTWNRWKAFLTRGNNLSVNTKRSRGMELRALRASYMFFSLGGLRRINLFDGINRVVQWNCATHVFFF